MNEFINIISEMIHYLSGEYEQPTKRIKENMPEEQYNRQNIKITIPQVKKSKMKTSNGITPECMASPMELPQSVLKSKEQPQKTTPVVNLNAINSRFRDVKENNFYDGTNNDYGFGQYTDIEKF